MGFFEHETDSSSSLGSAIRVGVRVLERYAVGSMASSAHQIGLVFETPETYPRHPGEPRDAHAEYEPETTVTVLEQAITALGYGCQRIGSPARLLAAVSGGELADLDAVLSIAEGYGSRNREAWAPVLLEMAGIPLLGSDALTLSLTLDKAWANRMAAACGIPVAPQCVMANVQQAREASLPADFPLFVKPRWEGSSKGILGTCRVESRADLVREVRRITEDYDQPALVEAFVPGAEYTVAVVGNAPGRALPTLQRALEIDSRIGLHALEKLEPPQGGWGHCLPGELGGALDQRLHDLALQAFAIFECRDFARIDFRLDADAEPVFLEINPLPTFATDGSFAILAELEGRSQVELLAEVFAGGLARLGVPATQTLEMAGSAAR